MLKKEISAFFKAYKIENELSYSQLASESGLGKTQLQSVLNKECEGVSLDRLIDSITQIGFKVSINVEVSDEP